MGNKKRRGGRYAEGAGKDLIVVTRSRKQYEHDAEDNMDEKQEEEEEEEEEE